MRETAPNKVTAKISQSPPVLASYLRLQGEKLLSIAPELEVKLVIGSLWTLDLSQEFWSSLESKGRLQGFSTQ